MDTQQRYLNWLNEPTLSKEEKDILKNLSSSEIEEAFYQDLSFGTGGIRGVLGLGTNRMNIYIIRKATFGFGRYLLKHNLLEGVAIAYDNRHMSYEFAKEAAKVLAALGIKSYVYKNLRPTPMLSFTVRHLNLSAGIMITASHNPKEYNGYKVYNKTGSQLSIDESNEVIEYINQVENPFEIKTLDNELIHYLNDEIDDIYLKEVISIAVHKDIKKDINIVYSPLHGTGGTLAPKLLKGSGYNVYPVESQMIPDPNFSATESSNPEEKQSFNASIELAKKVNADIILVTDPDADRLGVGVLHEGTYHLLTGNQTAALMLYYILSEQKTPDGFVYTTVVTSELIKKIGESFHKNIGETLTGFKFIGEQAERISKTNYTYLFGCEESYGSLVKDFVRDKDAIQAVYLLAEIANTLKSRNLTMVDYLNLIYEKYGYYVDETISISLKGIEGQQRIKKIMNYFRTRGLHINQFNVTNTIDYIKGKMNPHDIYLPPSDVIRFESDKGFIIFRPSGTEPKLKIYFSIKENTKELARNTIDILKQEVFNIIEEI
ncbi:phospho-sugar mutase [Acholeplasma equifetale]|uniref:phospho-sugar mutase n=1 Tax=Acholeplasma equifetale TaxID=264634 RepID=UPI00047CAF4F|nr:phospho-sugar mutase [Acholeplasma equifetale]